MKLFFKDVKDFFTDPEIHLPEKIGVLGIVFITVVGIIVILS